MTAHPTFEDHSENFRAMVSRLERYGQLEKPDGYGKRTGDCGDTIEMYLSVRGGQHRCLRQYGFDADGGEKSQRRLAVNP